jgi:hypothetical protein
VRCHRLSGGSLIEYVENLHLRVVNRIGEVIAVDAPHVRFPAVVVEPFHLILPRFMEVDCFLVESGERHRKRHFGNDLVIAGNIDDNEVIAAYGAKADGIGRVSVTGPVPGASGKME